jgi:hypothetical protein
LALSWVVAVAGDFEHVTTKALLSPPSVAKWQLLSQNLMLRFDLPKPVAAVAISHGSKTAPQDPIRDSVCQDFAVPT